MKARQRQRIEASRQRLADLGYENYRAYLQGDHWEDVRKRFWASKLPKTCGGCGAAHGLHLHHRTYKRIGAEWLTDLILVCAGAGGHAGTQSPFALIQEIRQWFRTPPVQFAFHLASAFLAYCVLPCTCHQCESQPLA